MSEAALISGHRAPRGIVFGYHRLSSVAQRVATLVCRIVVGSKLCKTICYFHGHAFIGDASSADAIVQFPANVLSPPPQSKRHHGVAPHVLG